MTAFTLKLDTLYGAYSTEMGVVSYGRCRDEALNNLSEEIRRYQQAAETPTGDEKR